VADKWVTVPADAGDVRARIVKPLDAMGMLPTILYMHVAEQRGDVRFAHQSMYYPASDAAQGTDSYRGVRRGPVPRRQVDGLVLGRAATTGAVEQAIHVLRKALGTA
jgi:hypothetical protein